MNDTKTLSLCHICYKHIPAERITKGDAVYLIKTCPEHGRMEYMVEHDVEFYNKLGYDRQGYSIPQGIMIEVTDRCNLNCPHCYHEPDNKIVDRPIDSILNQIKNLKSLHPFDTNAIILSGAEPTVRKDLPELIEAICKLIKDLDKGQQDVCILTNGVRLSDRAWVKRIAKAGAKMVMIGLNHPDYQGEKIHKKQLQGIDNCIAEGIFVYYTGYTLGSLFQMEDVLEEIQRLGNRSWQYRIRAGSDIGRSPDEPRFFLSDHVKLIKSICEKKGWTWEKKPADDNLYHYMVNINGITHRIIQWSDPKTIDMEQLKCGPWCDFVPFKPVTNFLHQIMLRDANVNNKKPLLDTVPDRYTFTPETVQYEVSDWTYKSQDKYKIKQSSLIS
jgi:MoaA/NifB/PqqE/SkfB family radical SAM enzyme